VSLRNSVRVGTIACAMEIHTRTEGDVTLIRLSGHLDATTVGDLKTEVAAIQTGGGSRICLSCQRMEFIDSTALGQILAMHKSLKAGGGELVISEPSRFLQSAIRTLELYHILEIFDSDKAAVAHFA
jgi:anti-sigma B factor antagonist